MAAFGDEFFNTISEKERTVDPVNFPPLFLARLNLIPRKKVSRTYSLLLPSRF